MDSTHWTSAPYDLVKNKKQYNKPHDYFSKDIADKILQAHSLQADLYWANNEMRNNKKRGYSEGKNPTLTKIKILWKWSMSCVIYALLIILGLCTAGWTWPKSFRRYLLAVGLKREKTACTSESISFEVEPKRKVSVKKKAIEDEQRDEYKKIHKTKDVKNQIYDVEDSDTVSDLSFNASQSEVQH